MAKKTAYPSKTTVNLVVKEKSSFRFSRVSLGLVLLVIAVGAFYYLAVRAPLQWAAEAESEAAAAEAVLAQLKEETTDYNAVREEYARFFSVTAGESGAADCMEVLELLETQLMPAAGVTSATFTGATLSVDLTGITLEQASGLIRTLTGLELVGGVQLSTADTGREETGAPRLTMTIALNTEGGMGSAQP